MGEMDEARTQQEKYFTVVVAPLEDMLQDVPRKTNKARTAPRTALTLKQEYTQSSLRLGIFSHMDYCGEKGEGTVPFIGKDLTISRNVYPNIYSKQNIHYLPKGHKSTGDG